MKLGRYGRPYVQRLAKHGLVVVPAGIMVTLCDFDSYHGDVLAVRAQRASTGGCPFAAESEIPRYRLSAALENEQRIWQLLWFNKLFNKPNELLKCSQQTAMKIMKCTEPRCCFAFQFLSQVGSEWVPPVESKG